jgi:hypothetical protein
MLTCFVVALQFRSHSKDGQEQDDDHDHEYRQTDYYKPSDRVPARQSSHLDLQVCNCKASLTCGVAGYLLP